MTMDWQGAPGSPSSYTVKRILRLEIPVDSYPNVSTHSASSSFYSISFLITLSDFLLAIFISSILLEGFLVLEATH